MAQAREAGLPEVLKPVRQREAIEEFLAAPKEQANIFIGHAGIERCNPDYYTLLVLDTILGSSPGFTSRSCGSSTRQRSNA